MATNGAVNTNSYSDAYLRLEWTRTSYDSAAGINYVHWVLKGVKSSSGYYWARNFKVTSYNFVTGNTTELYYSESDIKLYNDTIIAEGDDYFKTNPDGSCTIQFNIEGAIYTYAVNCTGYDSWVLDTIPRYANFTEHYISSTGLNSITVHWNADASCDYVQYSLNGGGWTDASGLTYTVYGLNPNTQYSIRTRIKRTDSQLWTESGYIYGTTKDIAKVTSASDFNLGDNAKIKISNPSGESINCFIETLNPTKTLLEKKAVVGENVIEFTQEELDTIYKKMGTANSITLRLGVATKASYWHWLDKTCTLRGNQKTGHINVNNSWKRAKKWVNVNGTWKRCIRWVNVNGTWKRCI